jgi:hypothetical protein
LRGSFRLKQDRNSVVAGTLEEYADDSAPRRREEEAVM